MNLYRETKVAEKQTVDSLLPIMIPQLVNFMASVFMFDDIGECSYEEAIKGDPDLHLDSMNLKSSNGIPATNLGVANGYNIWDDNRNRIHYEDKREIVCDFVETRAKLKVLEARKGKRVASIVKNCLKDELRPLAKIKDPKTRLFTAYPRETIVALRMVFGRFKAAFKRHRTDLFHGVGINPRSGDWFELQTRLKKHPHAIDEDFNSFDKRIPNEFMISACKVICDTIKTVTNCSDAQYLTMQTLMADVTTPYCVSYDNLIQLTSGNASGNPFTTEVNCIVNYLYHWYVFMVKTKLDSLADFRKHVEIVVYGDDVIQTVSDDAYEYYNFETIREVLSSIGQIVTPADKTDKVIDKTIEQLTFLQRGFVRDSDNGYVIKAPLNKDAIESCWNYNAIDEHDVASWAELTRMTLGEACLHGEKYYNFIKGRILQKLQELRHLQQLYIAVNLELQSSYASCYFKFIHSYFQDSVNVRQVIYKQREFSCENRNHVSDLSPLIEYNDNRVFDSETLNCILTSEFDRAKYLEAVRKYRAPQYVIVTSTQLTNFCHQIIVNLDFGYYKVNRLRVQHFNKTQCDLLLYNTLIYLLENPMASRQNASTSTADMDPFRDPSNPNNYVNLPIAPNGIPTSVINTGLGLLSCAEHAHLPKTMSIFSVPDSSKNGAVIFNLSVGSLFNDFMKNAMAGNTKFFGPIGVEVQMHGVQGTSGSVKIGLVRPDQTPDLNNIQLAQSYQFNVNESISQRIVVHPISVGVESMPTGVAWPIAPDAVLPYPNIVCIVNVPTNNSFNNETLGANIELLTSFEPGFTAICEALPKTPAGQLKTPFTPAETIPLDGGFLYTDGSYAINTAEDEETIVHPIMWQDVFIDPYNSALRPGDDAFKFSTAFYHRSKGLITDFFPNESENVLSYMSGNRFEGVPTDLQVKNFDGYIVTLNNDDFGLYGSGEGIYVNKYGPDGEGVRVELKAYSWYKSQHMETSSTKKIVVPFWFGLDKLESTNEQGFSVVGVTRMKWQEIEVGVDANGVLNCWCLIPLNGKRTVKGAAGYEDTSVDNIGDVASVEKLLQFQLTNASSYMRRTKEIDGDTITTPLNTINVLPPKCFRLDWSGKVYNVAEAFTVSHAPSQRGRMAEVLDSNLVNFPVIFDIRSKPYNAVVATGYAFKNEDTGVSVFAAFNDPTMEYVTFAGNEFFITNIRPFTANSFNTQSLTAFGNSRVTSVSRIKKDVEKMKHTKLIAAAGLALAGGALSGFGNAMSQFGFGQLNQDWSRERMKDQAGYNQDLNNLDWANRYNYYRRQFILNGYNTGSALTQQATIKRAPTTVRPPDIVPVSDGDFDFSGDGEPEWDNYGMPTPQSATQRPMIPPMTYMNSTKDNGTQTMTEEPHESTGRGGFGSPNAPQGDPYLKTIKRTTGTGTSPMDFNTHAGTQTETAGIHIGGNQPVSTNTGQTTGFDNSTQTQPLSGVDMGTQTSLPSGRVPQNQVFTNSRLAQKHANRNKQVGPTPINSHRPAPKFTQDNRGMLGQSTYIYNSNRVPFNSSVPRNLEFP